MTHKLRKGDFGELKSKQFPEGACPQTSLEVRNRSVFKDPVVIQWRQMYQKVWASCKMSFCLLRLHVRSHRNEQSFHWLKNLTQYLVHKEPFDPLALFTRTDEQSWILTFVSGLTICSCAERYCSKSKMASGPATFPCNYTFPVQKKNNNIRLWYSHREMYDVIGIAGNFLALLTVILESRIHVVRYSPTSR